MVICLLRTEPIAQTYLRHSTPLPSNLRPSCISRVYFPGRFGVGFLFGDTTTRGIVYSDELFQHMRHIPSDSTPKQIVNQLASTDTLLAYAMYNGPYLRPWLTVTTIDPLMSSTRKVLTKLQPNRFSRYTCYPVWQRLGFSEGVGPVKPISLSTLMMYCEFIPTFGVYNGTSATTVQFDARLDDTIGRSWPVEIRDVGRNGNSSDTLIVTLTNYLDYMNDRGDTQPPYGWDYRWGGVGVSLSTGATLLGHQDELYGPRDIRVADFVLQSPGDELIYLGTSRGLLDEYPSARSILACYDFVDGVPHTRWIREVDQNLVIETIWYLDSRPFALVCSKGGSSFEMVLVHSGQTFRSGVLDMTLSPFTMYTDSLNGSWNVEIAGCANSQLYVYSIDAVVSVEDTTWSRQGPVSDLVIEDGHRGPLIVSYTLPAPGHVTIDVYNILGQKAASVVNEYQSAGPHRRQWDRTSGKGEPLSSGIYFVRLVANGNSASKKIRLVR